MMRHAGIVGAGGGGFPTYFKWKNPQPNLIVNCTESEPGYWADKMVHREYFDEFLELFDAMKTIFEIEHVIMGVHFKDEEWFSPYKEQANGLYSVSLVPDKYSMGEEKTLIKNIFNEDKEKWVPRRVEMPDGSKRPGLPLDAGPYLNEMGIESLGEGDAYVRRTTNGFLVIPKGVASKEYADIKTQLPEEGFVSLVGKVSGVDLPLGGRFLKPATPLISEGDEVEYEQKIGEPVDEGFSIGVWASMAGTVSSIEGDVVAISGGAMSQEQARKEAEAEAAR